MVTGFYIYVDEYLSTLFNLTTVLIWGSTFIAIPLQLGEVPGDVSIAYRFGLVGICLVGTFITSFGNMLSVRNQSAKLPVMQSNAYCMVLFPIVALALSTVFENYRWTTEAVAGVSLVLAGNLLVIVPKEKLQRVVRILRPTSKTT